MTSGSSLDWVASIEDYTPTVSKGATYKMVMGGCSMMVCTIWELVPISSFGSQKVLVADIDTHSHAYLVSTLEVSGFKMC